jgi:hypothetical protein
MSENAVLQEKSLRAALAPGFAPVDALTELARQKLEIRWPGGKGSQLHVSYEPGELACVTHGEVPIHTSSDDVATKQGYKVVVPLQAVLRSEDGRLLVRLGGFAETAIADDGTWDRFVEAQLDYTPIARLAPGERAGFDLAAVPDGQTAVLYTWLRTPITDYEKPGLTMRVCQPFEGAPPYPDVVEDAPNRLGCFCQSESGTQTASIRNAPAGIAAPRETKGLNAQ